MKRLYFIQDTHANKVYKYVTCLLAEFVARHFVKAWLFPCDREISSVDSVNLKTLLYELQARYSVAAEGQLTERAL